MRCGGCHPWRTTKKSVHPNELNQKSDSNPDSANAVTRSGQKNRTGLLEFLDRARDQRNPPPPSVHNSSSSPRAFSHNLANLSRSAPRNTTAACKIIGRTDDPNTVGLGSAQRTGSSLNISLICSPPLLTGLPNRSPAETIAKRCPQD